MFIVNDDPHLALACDADGVHVGQEDVAVKEARDAIGPDAILGLSTHSEDQVGAARELGVDYISVGPVWETPTKPGRAAVGLELVSIRRPPNGPSILCDRWDRPCQRRPGGRRRSAKTGRCEGDS